MSIRDRKAQSQFISYDGICYNKEFEDVPYDVDGAKAIVTKFYYAKHRKWYIPNQKITAKQFTDVFLVRAGLRRQGGKHDGNNS